MDLGYDRENLVYIPIEGDLARQYRLFKEQAMTLPGVAAVSHISDRADGDRQYYDSHPMGRAATGSAGVFCHCVGGV